MFAMRQTFWLLLPMYLPLLRSAHVVISTDRRECRDLLHGRSRNFTLYTLHSVTSSAVLRRRKTIMNYELRQGAADAAESGNVTEGQTNCHVPLE